MTKDLSEYFVEEDLLGRGDGAVGKVLVSQVQGPEFGSPEPMGKLGHSGACL